MLNKYLLFVIIAIVAFSFIGSYTAPTFDSINFSLCSGYEAPTFDSINFSLAEDDSCIVDTCTYSSGNWEINCNDNCSIEENVDLGGNDMVFTGVGSFWLKANLTNYGNLNLSSGCSIIFDDNTFLIN